MGLEQPAKDARVIHVREQVLRLRRGQWHVRGGYDIAEWRHLRP
jgi:hypothetical protein